MNRKIMIPACLFAAGVAAAGGLAFAKQSASAENDAVTDLANAKISLVQAVSAAEAQVTGKATKAELENERGALVYDVEAVTSDNKVFDVKVNAINGKVLSSTLDAVDHADKEDRDEKD